MGLFNNPATDGDRPSNLMVHQNQTPIKSAICGSVNFDSTNMVNCLLGKTKGGHLTEEERAE